MRLLKDEEIEELLKEAEEGRGLIEKKNEEANVNGRNIKKHEKEIENFKKEMKANEKNVIRAIDARNAALRATLQLSKRIEEIEKTIKSNKREKSIRDAIDTIPDFYDSLVMEVKEGRIEDPFIEYRDVERAIKAIRLAIESKQFTNEVMDLREYKNSYESIIRRLCEKRVDGATITTREAKQPKEHLAWVLSKTERYFHK